MRLFAPLSLLVLGAIVDNIAASPAQIPFQTVQHTKPRKLHGRFLHITDIHPDPHYVPHTAPSTACHRKKSKKKKNDSSFYGTPYSECDSPLVLTNYTLDYLKENWSNDIDFVIWTGDNARHDNDRQLPRTPSEIYMLNRAVADKMFKFFASKGIPVVPSLGNNDVWPHNILTPGPNAITNEFSSIWSQFIPFPYLQVFQRGAYFTVEVIPDEVAVISLNTMYFYDSNKVVSGCPYLKPDDPGNLQLDWLEVQLDMYRQRGIQVWISGHVPPSSSNYFPECYVRYVDLALRYQGTILGHLFGHMNVDHFFLLEAQDLEKAYTGKDVTSVAAETGDLDLSVLGHDENDIWEALVEEFSGLPTSPKMDNYAIVNVAPAVVPNPYLPAFRIFSYNVTDREDPSMQKALRRKRGGRRHDGDVNCKSPEHQKTWHCHLGKQWYSDEHSPSRQNQRWSPIGFAQYYMPKLERGSKTHAPKFELEYLTYNLDSLHPGGGQETEGDEEFAYPIPIRHLPKSLREPGRMESKYAPYGMRDLTIPSWIRLAHQLGREKSKKLRKRFRKYMTLGAEIVEDSSVTSEET